MSNTEELRGKIRGVMREWEDMFPFPDPDDAGEEARIAHEVPTKLIELFDQELKSRERQVLEGLLDWQDQESDLDGRPLGKPYYLITGTSRETIEMALETLNNQDDKTKLVLLHGSHDVVCPIHHWNLTTNKATECIKCVEEFEEGKVKNIFRRLNNQSKENP